MVKVKKDELTLPKEFEHSVTVDITCSQNTYLLIPVVIAR